MLLNITRLFEFDKDTEPIFKMILMTRSIKLRMKTKNIIVCQRKQNCGVGERRTSHT